MLEFIRNRAQSWVAWVVVGLIIIPFALFGIGDYATGGAEDNVAVVNDVNISQREFQAAFYQQEQRLKQMLGENYDSSLFENQMRKNVLDGLIDQELMIQSARSEGLRVSGIQLASIIQGVSSFQSDGVFDRATYESTLKMQGQSAAYFESRVHRDVLSQQLYSAVSESTVLTDHEIDLLLMLQNQKREIGYIRILAEQFQSNAVISDEDVSSHYSASIERYKMPERVGVEYLELNADLLKDGIDISDSALEEAYQDQKETLATPEQRKASHILIEVPFEASDDEKQLAEKRAAGILVKLDEGETFADLAKEFSDDLGSAELGGDLGLFGKGDMVPEFDAKVFSMNIGDTSGLVATEFGYHIIRLDEIEQSKVPEFSEVKDELLSQLESSEAERKYYDLADKLTNIAFEHPDGLEVAADELGLSIERVENVMRSGAKGILGNPLVSRALFSDDVLNERLNSEPIEVKDGHLVVVRVSSHEPAQAKPLDSVRDEIVTFLTQRYGEAKAQSKGEDILAEIESGQGIDNVSDKFNVEFHDVGLVGRSDGSIDGAILNRAFELPRISQAVMSVGTVSLGGDYAVVVVKSIEQYKIEDISDPDRASMRQQMTGVVGNANFESFSRGLREASSVAILLEE